MVMMIGLNIPEEIKKNGLLCTIAPEMKMDNKEMQLKESKQEDPKAIEMIFAKLIINL